MPELVRPLADLPGGAGLMPAPAVNPQQLAAIDEPGVVFVSAGAGTGKTTVLVERYVKAVMDRGLAIDSVLVITYTERAAGELKERIRARLRELGRRDLAREVDRAWISTIHGFCFRLLRAHPFEAGLDPRFRVLDEGQAQVIASSAFAEALAEFCSDRRPERLQLLATYRSPGLQRMLVGVFESLRSAGMPLDLAAEPADELGPRVEELRGAATRLLSGLEDAAAPVGELLRGLLETVRADTPADRLLDLAAYTLPPGQPDADGAVAYAEALEALEGAALETVAARDRELLQELLLTFDRSYRRAKERESALDFEDLQLGARELLQADAGVRERTRFRIRSIMVDEFQDTNRLQCEIVDLIAGDELFFVGDEFQSIYRFRHADVDVFRERRSQSRGVLALTENYRSRPEVVQVVNHLFAGAFGEAFEPLSASALFTGPLAEPAVEVLVTDKASYRGSRTGWREAEARHVARRVRELVDGGSCTPGEVVLLFAAGTSAEIYEQALRGEGLPTYRATGRGYFSQQQVVDLLAYLRLLLNRYDDEALATVLASPLVGVSNDALVLLRRAAGRRPLFTGLEREPPAHLSARDRRLFEAFRQRYERLVVAAGMTGLERLCERIVTEHDYDLAVLARWDGKRRYANLRKLGRLARSFEELRGPDLEGFVRFIRDQEASGAREVEAVAEEEGAEAVRLLTIHAAKGLEFRVVVVCDAGRRGGRPDPDEILCLPDGRFGFRVVDPVTGKRRDADAYVDVSRAEAASETEEAQRLYYVAMTRAIDRLILAGAYDPTRSDATASPIGWVIDSIGAGLDPGGRFEVSVEGVPVSVSVDRLTAVEPSGSPSPTEQLALFESEPSALTPDFELPPLAPVPEPLPPRVRRLSYSALALYERCSYRYYAERIVGLPEEPPVPAAADEGLGATEIGDAVHVVLEAQASGEDARAMVARRYPTAATADFERIDELVEAWRASTTARELEGLRGVSRELAFAFEHDGVLLHGFFDLFHRDGDRALIVDYKTNRLDGKRPSEIVESDYRLQQLVYALAAFCAGALEVRIVYSFLERPDQPVERTYGPADRQLLAEGLSEAIARIEAGSFRPTPSEFACLGCPVLGRVCAGPGLDAGPGHEGHLDPVGAEMGYVHETG